MKSPYLSSLQAFKHKKVELIDFGIEHIDVGFIELPVND